MALVYLAESPSKKYYVGVTKRTLAYRKKEHYYIAKNLIRRGKFQYALLKYANNFKWIILEQNITYVEALEKEKYYIQKYDSFNSGYNGTLGGDSSIGAKHSEDSKLRRSAWFKNLKKSFTPEIEKKRVKALKKYCKNNPDKISLERGGKPIVMLTINGKFIEEAINVSKLSRKYKLHRQNVRKCLKGQRKHTQDYIFIYKDSYYGPLC